MSLSDFLNEWNVSMHTNISSSDIKAPSETLFRRWLICILKNLNMDTTCFDSMESETKERIRLQRIKLVTCVNYFYKISMPNSKFCYFDIVQPSFKTVFTVLKYLLNYYHYVAMIQQETIMQINDKIVDRTELLVEKNQLRKEIEGGKIKDENYAKGIRDLHSKIPTQKALRDDLEEKQKHLKTDIRKIQEELKKSDTKILEIRSEISDLDSQLVSDNEAVSIVNAKEDVENQIAEQEQIIYAVRKKLEENTVTIENLQSSIKKMESMHELMNIDASEVKANKNLLDSLTSSIAALKSSIDRNNTEIELTCKQLEKKQADLDSLIKKGFKITQKYKSKKAQQVKKLKEKEAQLKRISKKESVCLETNQRIRSEGELLFTVASNAIKLLGESAIIKR